VKFSKLTPLLLLFPFISTACSIIKFTDSLHRDSMRPELKVNDDLSIRPTGIVYMNMAGIMKADFFSAGFNIRYKDKNIYIDPLVVGNASVADYILITHVHADHFSREDIEKIYGEKTTIIGPEAVTRKLKNLKSVTARPGDTLKFENIEVFSVHAYNLKKGFLHSPLHKRNSNYLGYLLKCGESTIYHAGDTDLVPEMNEFGKISIALVPVGVGKTAMSPEAAANAVNLIKPEIAIPMHYDIDENPVPRFRENVKDGITVVEF